MGFDFTRRQWLTIVVISIADFCNAICVALQAPFYPQEAEKKGCTATEYGLVFGVFELVVFLVSPIYGAHLNRLGPKLLFNGGILTTGTCAIFFGMLDKVEGHVPFITLSFIIRIVEAMGNAAFLTASFAIIAKEFPNNVATMFASLETFFGLGLIVGPTLGGALYDFGGYFLPFAVLGFALFCAAVMSCLVLPKNHDDEDLKPSGPSMISLLKVPGVVLSALSIMVTSMSIGFLQATLEPHLRQFQFSSMVLGLMFVINGGVYAVSAPGWGWLCDHPAVRPKYVIAVGCAFVAGGFLLIGPAPFFDMQTQLWAIIVGLMLHGFGMGSQLVASFSDALGTAIASGLPNSIETYGLVSGMWTSTFALGAFIGPTVSGLLFDSIGFRSSTLFIFILHVLVMVMMLMFTWTCDRSSKMDVSVSAGDLLQIDGTLDESVLIGDKFLPPTRTKSRRCGISVEQSRPPAMNSLIACSSYKNRRSPWSQRTPRYRPTYGSLDHRYASFLTMCVPGVVLSALSIMVTSMSIGFLQATLEPHLRQFQFSSMVLGLMFVINGGVYAVSAPGWGWLCDHPAVRPKYVIAVGCAFVAGGFLLIGPAPFFDMQTQLWAIIVGLMLHGFGMGSQLVASFSDALGTAIASGLPNSIETYGLVSGMWTSTFALGAFIGPTVSGLLFDSIGFRSSTLFIFILHVLVMVMMLMFTWTCDRSSKMDVSVSAGDLLQIDGTLDESVLIGDKFLPPTRTKSRRCGISVEQSRPPAMNSLIACSSYKNRRSPWSQRTPRYRPTYGSLDHRYRGAYNT